jgi:hypothetical protein
MEKTFEPNYALDAGDVVLVKVGGSGICEEDEGKYVEVVAKGDYFGRDGVKVNLISVHYTLDICGTLGVDNVVGYESFGESPLILLNTFDENVKEDTSFNSSLETRKNGKNKMELVETGFPNAFLALGEVMSWAADYKGYEPNDWKDIPDAKNSLLAAAARHRVKRLAGQAEDDESGLPHLYHEAFNVMAQLELLITGKL